MVARKARAAPHPTRPQARKSTPRAATGSDGGPRAGAAASELLSRISDAAVVLLALVSLVLLWRRAAGAVFQTDECFHAHVAQWIAAHGRLPREVPELYSGFAYFYPPLFHIVGAVSVAIAGVASLPFLNVILTGLLYLLLVAVPFAGVQRTPRLWTIVILVANASLSAYVLRFYAETLATLLAVLFILLLLRLRARQRPLDGIAVGLAAGLALVEKQPFVLFPALLALLAAIYAFRHERRLMNALLIALGVSVVVSAPFFIRNQILFRSPFYPAASSAAQQALDALNTRMFSVPPGEFYRLALLVAGPVIPWLAVAALIWSLVRGPRDLTSGVLALCLAFTVTAPLVHRFEARHLNPFIAVTALLSCLVLYDALARRRAICNAAQWALIAWAAFTLYRQPNVRPQMNAPPVLMEAFRAVKQNVPAGSTVLSLWTYDTFYYSGRNATWPIPWSRSAEQLPLFEGLDPDHFLATLDRESIDYLLVPRSPPPPQFNGGNYPRPFVDSMVRLLEAGRLRIVWQSEAVALVARVH